MLNEQGGELVAVLRGANAPMLQRMIVEELAKEKLVLEQGGERRVVRSSLYTFTHISARTIECFSANMLPCHGLLKH